MQTRYLKWIAVFTAVVIASALVCALAFAAPEVDNSPVTLELKDVDIQTALTALFRGRGHSFSLAPDVKGVVPTLYFKEVPFKQALKNLLKSAGLVASFQNNVYTIKKKPQLTDYTNTAADTDVEEVEVDDTTTVETSIEKIPLNHSSASEILATMSGQSNQGGMGGYGGGGYGGGGYGGGMMGGMMGGSSRYGGGSSYGGGGFGGSSYGGYGGYGGGSSRYGGGSSYGGYGGGSSYGGYGGSSRRW